MMLILWDTYANGAAGGQRRHPTSRTVLDFLNFSTVFFVFPVKLKVSLRKYTFQQLKHVKDALILHYAVCHLSTTSG